MASQSSIMLKQGRNLSWQDAIPHSRDKRASRINGDLIIANREAKELRELQDEKWECSHCKRLVSFRIKKGKGGTCSSTCRELRWQGMTQEERDADKSLGLKAFNYVGH